MLRIGLLINPYAGIGGTVALKGSDGEAIREEALRRGAELRAVQRARRTFTTLAAADVPVQLCCWDGAMGADALSGLGLGPMWKAFAQTICGGSTVGATNWTASVCTRESTGSN